VITVHVQGHKDGDHLVIVKEPLPKYVLESLLNKVCPCCGWRGRVLGPFEKLHVFLDSKWNSAIGWLMRFEKEVYKVPIDSYCKASSSIWGNEEFCWHEPNCFGEELN
jgi:hypothetical protein